MGKVEPFISYAFLCIFMIWKHPACIETQASDVD